MRTDFLSGLSKKDVFADFYGSFEPTKTIIYKYRLIAHLMFKNCFVYMNDSIHNIKIQVIVQFSSNTDLSLLKFP